MAGAELVRGLRGRTRYIFADECGFSALVGSLRRRDDKKSEMRVRRSLDVGTVSRRRDRTYASRECGCYNRAFITATDESALEGLVRCPRINPCRSERGWKDNGPRAPRWAAAPMRATTSTTYHRCSSLDRISTRPADYPK